ncbi:MAG TPA: methyltransferase domain-containing protein [Albitalea sp.]|uniref:class I SAM-dependent methyltransferase n=1 Tax=Piscinibacter sp. TaxID=1903157 RepID=UPI002ED4FF02
MAQHDPADARRLDEHALDAVLRRLARRPEPPWLHGEIARRMAERLAVVRLQPQRVLDWWSFLGASRAVLQQAYPKAQIVAVEPTTVLAERSRRLQRAPWWSPRRAPGVMLEHDEPGEPAQLVWANMMLHAVKDPPALMARWQRALAADGFVMFSCLGPDTLRELRDLYAALGWPAPMAPLVDMHDLGDMLGQAGFADPVMDQETLTLHWASPQALIEELRSLGGNVATDRAAGLRTPRWRAALEEALRARAAPDGRIAMRFEIAYGHAFKALPRMRTDAPTTVSLEEMRSLVRSGRRS